MKKLQKLFENNKKWAKSKQKDDPYFFSNLSKKQAPKYLWIGCADSRVPVNEILGLAPGEIFVHRNVANMCPHTDFNCLSVLQYGIDYLGVNHVIVCGHYGCGGIASAMEPKQFGLIDNWLRNIRDVASRETLELSKITDPIKRNNRLAELNVMHQVMNVCHTTIVQNAWDQGKDLTIHGWIYDLSSGQLKDLDCCISSLDQVNETYRTLQLH